MFYQLFLSDSCLGKQCYYNCKYKYDHSSADIRIGDLWGKTYSSDEEGVSGVVAFTQKGDEILKQCNCDFVEHSFVVVAERQMKRMPIFRWYFHVTHQLLKIKYVKISQVIVVQKYLKNIYNRINLIF